MSIDGVLVNVADPVLTALKCGDRNGLGLVFAVDGAGRLAGRLDARGIAHWLAQGGSLAAPVEDAMQREPEALPEAAGPAAIARTINGSGAVVPLIDDERRPIDVISPARRRRIPVAEPVLTGNESKYVNECLATNWISSQGAFVRRFEADFANLIGAPHAVAVANGTAALHLALVALGIGPGDEVIVPDLTFAATINTVIHAGATPIIVDVDPGTWNIDPASVAGALSARTRAIVPVHLYGQPADMDAIMALALRHRLLVIEDAAEAVGSSHRGRACGSIGQAGTFSFFSNKLLTTGEGGMAVFRDGAAAERARILRDHGMDPKRRYWHTEIGYNYRLTNLQAAIGCAQIEAFDRLLATKLRIAGRYRNGMRAIEGLVLPAEIEGLVNSFWAFSIICDMRRLGISRDEFMARLEKAGIESRPLFYPLHAMPPYLAHAGNRAMPAATYLSANGLSLPSALSLTDAEIDYICGVIERLHCARMLARQAGLA
ncbi:MAG: aminotransferase class I/II-fold pyridoxal phosphate-dependent enzyme [Pseudomonadota bacterium]